MIIQNAIAIMEDWPNVTYLVSTFTHDFQTHTFHDGTSVSVDGGRDYIKRCFDSKNPSYGTKWMEYCVDDREPMYAIKSKLLWGTRGKDGTEPLRWGRLVDFSVEHLVCLLKYLNHPSNDLNPIYKKVVEEILYKDKKYLPPAKLVLPTLTPIQTTLIHKAKRPKYYYVNPTVCGVNLSYQDSNKFSRIRWNKVTCPDCLKLRKNETV